MIGGDPPAIDKNSTAIGCFQRRYQAVGGADIRQADEHKQIIAIQFALNQNRLELVSNRIRLCGQCGRRVANARLDLRNDFLFLE